MFKYADYLPLYRRGEDPCPPGRRSLSINAGGLVGVYRRLQLSEHVLIWSLRFDIVQPLQSLSEDVTEILQLYPVVNGAGTNAEREPRQGFER